MSIAVIIPTYNEKENLPKIVSRLLELPVKDLSILVIDDNSPDGTGKIADDLSRQFPKSVSVLHRPGKMGLGTAYITGFKTLLATDVDAIVQMDADFSHPPEKIVEFAAAMPDCDVVFGSRYVPGGSLDHDWPAWRKFLSRFGNEYARAILGIPVKDLTGGFRLWKREVLSTIPLDEIRSNGYVFQVEMAYVTKKLGFKIVEIPIYFAERKFGQSKMNLSIQLEAAFRVWQLKPRYQKLHQIK